MQIYTPLLRHGLRRYHFQDSDVGDLIQEVLATVSRELPEFRHNQRKGAFRSWLRRILVNRLRDLQRSAKYRPIVTGASSMIETFEELEDDASGVSQSWDQQHDMHVMKRLMELVRPQFEPLTWQAFRLQAVDGLSAQEVASQLQMTMNSVYLAKSRVLNNLRREADGLID